MVLSQKNSEKEVNNKHQHPKFTHEEEKEVAAMNFLSRCKLNNKHINQRRKKTCFDQNNIDK